MECGGQCLIDSSCDTFSFVSNECKLLKSDQLFKDDTEQLEIYMEASLAAREYDEYRSVIWILVSNLNLILRNSISNIQLQWMGPGRHGVPTLHAA